MPLIGPGHMWTASGQKPLDVPAAMFECERVSGRFDATEKAAGRASFQRTADQRFLLMAYAEQVG